jgi:hypothetical protein
MSTAPRAYLYFHLNLGFSSIPIERRPDVVRSCYKPLLDLIASTGIPIGIELSGWTLERILELDPDWVDRFRSLLDGGFCELVGSGYSQMIGPLVPEHVNQWNQELGLRIYERELSVRPRIVLVNEMALSSGMLDVYESVGYEGIIMDGDNVRLALSTEDRPTPELPTHGIGTTGAKLPVLWADTLLFQKFQRYVHGDIRWSDYEDYVRYRLSKSRTAIPVYANDAEVFDFRPGRFDAESPPHPEGEWERCGSALHALSTDSGVVWISPSQALEEVIGLDSGRSESLVSVAQPIPVKKQAKYNISRWAVTGRNDIWINTMCHRLAQRLVDGPAGPDDAGLRQALCELWSSDLRTHISIDRWDDACRRLEAIATLLEVPLEYGVADDFPTHASVPPTPLDDRFMVARDQENILLSVESETVRVELNLRRGLTIQSLAFRSHGFVPTVGTLPLGFFDSIELGADFYSGGVVIELPAQGRRVTDLERVEPEIVEHEGCLLIRAQVATNVGTIVKSVRIPQDDESIVLECAFPDMVRTNGSVRAGILTLLPDAFDGELRVRCRNGGPADEVFEFDRPIDHGAPASTLVSSTSGLGATDGRLEIGDGERALRIQWDPAQCAVLPQLVHRIASPSSLTRVMFSLHESDETARPGGHLGALRLSISPT